MYEAMKKNIETLSAKAASMASHDANGAMKLSQSALNLANAYSQVANTDLYVEAVANQAKSVQQ